MLHYTKMYVKGAECMCNLKPLDKMERGEVGIVWEMRSEDRLRRRLQDMGMIQGTAVECVGISPLGDPAAYLVRGAVIALRREDSGSVLVNCHEC